MNLLNQTSSMQEIVLDSNNSAHNESGIDERVDRLAKACDQKLMRLNLLQEEEVQLDTQIKKAISEMPSESQILEAELGLIKCKLNNEKLLNEIKIMQKEVNEIQREFVHKEKFAKRLELAQLDLWTRTNVEDTILQHHRETTLMSFGSEAEERKQMEAEEIRCLKTYISEMRKKMEPTAEQLRENSEMLFEMKEIEILTAEIEEQQKQHALNQSQWIDHLNSP